MTTLVMDMANSALLRASAFISLISVTPDMPHNVTVARHSPTSVVLMTDGPRANTGQPITSWMLKYEKVHGKKSKTFFFPQGL